MQVVNLITAASVIAFSGAIKAKADARYLERLSPSSPAYNSAGGRQRRNIRRAEIAAAQGDGSLAAPVAGSPLKDDPVAFQIYDHEQKVKAGAYVIKNM